MKTEPARQILFFSLFIITFLLEISRLPSAQEAKTESPREASGALRALEFWTAARAYPAGDVPHDAYYRAWEGMKLQVRKTESAQSGETWEFLGPNNFAGRTISLAVNPLNAATVYAGAAAGGLWVSHTRGLGADWTRVTTGFPVLGVNAIAIDPTDTNTIFIGTGELYRYQQSNGGIVVRTTRGSVGMGILKTTDGGATWEKSLDWSYNQQRGVSAIRFNPLNTSTLLAATSEGVYRSTDRGGSWAPVLDTLMARDIAMHPADTTLVLATCGNFASPGSGIYRSTDGGASFVRLPGFPSFSGMAVLGVFPARPDTVFLSISDSTTTVGTFWESMDFGESWVLKNTDNSGDVQGWYARFVAVHPQNVFSIVRGAQSLYKSTDGGSSFFGLGGGWADYHAYAYDPTDPNALYIADDGGVWRSTNFGNTFTYAGEGLETSQFYNGFSSSANDSLRAIGQVQDHFGWMFTGTKVWVESAVDESGWTAINQTTDQIMYAVGRDGSGPYKSTNRGVSFNWSGNGIGSGSGCWNTPIVISSSNPSVLYFGLDIVYKTTNAGQTWSATNGGFSLDGNPPICMAMSHTGTDTVYVGTSPLNSRSHLYRTADGGVSWSDVTGILPDRYPLDLTVDPTDPAVVYAAYGGFDSSHVFRSADAGGSWTDITGSLPDVPATALLVDSLHPQIVYAGTDIGVFVSTNSGGDWQSWDEGFPEAVLISDLTVSPTNRTIRASTHSNGVYERPMLDIPTGVAGGGAIPDRYALRQNYPNPFNPTTRIVYTVGTPPSAGEASSAGQRVVLKVYDLVGREVATLVDEELAPGEYSKTFDGIGLSTGVYYYTLRAGDFIATRKMLLLR